MRGERNTVENCFREWHTVKNIKIIVYYILYLNYINTTRFISLPNVVRIHAKQHAKSIWYTSASLQKKENELEKMFNNQGVKYCMMKRTSDTRKVPNVK